MSIHTARRAVGMVVATLFVLAPQAALACPYCAGRAKGGIATDIILGAFVFLPFLLSWALYRIIRAHQDPPPASHGEPRAQSSRRQFS